MKKNVILITALFTYLFGAANAQMIKEKYVENFKGAKELYVFTDGPDLVALNDEKFNFLQLVTNTWKDKNVISISPKEFNKLDGVKTKFYISLVGFSQQRYHSNGYAKSTSVVMDGVIIQQGKTTIGKGEVSSNLLAKAMYWSSLDYGNLNADILRFNVQNIKMQIDNINDSSLRKTGMANALYLTEGLGEYLNAGTLYILDPRDMSEAFQKNWSPENWENRYKKVCPFKYKIVRLSDYNNAIANKEENILLVDFAGRNINIFSAKEGRLVASSFNMADSGLFARMKEFK